MHRLRAALAPYFLILPGGLWLAIFFVIPAVFMLSLSLQTGDVVTGFTPTWSFSNYTHAISLYHTQLIRSLLYGLAATVIAIVLAYPMAYWIAFHGGARKSTYLLLMLLPFFVSFVLRTTAWSFLLSDNGVLLGPLKAIGLLPEDFHILATAPAVILGLTYNWLPFMVLPIYLALDRVDHRVVEAGRDLYAGKAAIFGKIILPLSLPGVFAGVIMTFVPASSDFVNAQVLGGTANTMIGNVIQSQYFVASNYPIASVLSFTLMALLLIGIFAYARALGTKEIMEAAAR
ncbi:ABC transporter permease [Fodinicola acaciae]|uniref:ABC transporter permease n=1 Tax=Fodinicola acaciae TaxID=2681555 RepID=UPI0013D3F792|nr:ABC transporter permease [Fodinicola acaciae]